MAGDERATSWFDAEYSGEDRRLGYFHGRGRFPANALLRTVFGLADKVRRRASRTGSGGAISDGLGRCGQCVLIVWLRSKSRIGGCWRFEGEELVKEGRREDAAGGEVNSELRALSR